MTCSGCMRVRKTMIAIGRNMIQRVVPPTRKTERNSNMPEIIPYKVIYADGRESEGSLTLPARANDPESKLRYRKIRDTVLEVIGAENDPEHVTVWHDSRYLDMFVDETGVLKELPFNEKATKIYRANVQAHEPNPEPEDEMPIICGNAVLFLEKVWK